MAVKGYFQRGDDKKSESHTDAGIARANLLGIKRKKKKKKIMSQDPERFVEGALSDLIAKIRMLVLQSTSWCIS